MPYTITLTDSKEGGEYRLTSLKEGERYHQTIGKDFVLSLTNDPKTPINKEQKYLSFSSKGTHSFYIRPLVPGTFKLNFELQKYIGDKPIGDAVKVNVSFNAVKIEVRESGAASSESYNYYVYINDGNEEGDTYFNKTNISQLYESKIVIDDDEVIIGRDFHTKSGIHKVFIKYIKITQRETNLPDFIIQYHNVQIDEILGILPFDGFAKFMEEKNFFQSY